MKHSIHAQSKFAKDRDLFARSGSQAICDSLIFEWDDATGEVTGPSASLVLEMVKGMASYGPPPGSYWTFTANALKSRGEMALLIASCWELPEEFRADLQALPVPRVTYPQMH